MLSIFDGLRDITLASVAFRLILSTLCGGIVGMEREFKRRSAGFRTHILICLGAAMTTLTSEFWLVYMRYYLDAARLGAGVVWNRIYFGLLDLEELTESENDFKSRLIEWCQKNRHKVSFRTGFDKEAAPNHPVFHCTVLVDGMEVGHGAGDSKKEAEQHAAFSVSQYMTDEQCASLLDKVDRLTGTK